jgi:A/G-specific adenine glycosylase
LFNPGLENRKAKDSFRLTQPWKKKVCQALLTWFSVNQRLLPWRGTSDPYRVMVSEFMLQQTQVSSVIPYYVRFMEQYPTLESLAVADEQEVLRLWAGLGYYQRARNLQQAARKILSEHKGLFPTDLKAACQLPGFGPYTAGAVLSIALGQQVALVDGNVERVLARLLSLSADPTTTVGKKVYWEVARQLIPVEHPGDFNQSLMELGATVCTPIGPTCPFCPLAALCQACKQKKVDQYPVKSPRRVAEKYTEAVLILWQDGKVLLGDHNEVGVFEGLWQFPWLWHPGRVAAAVLLERLLDTFSLSGSQLESIHQLTHGVTYRSIRTTFYLLRISGQSVHLPDLSYRWMPWNEVMQHPLPAYQQRILPVLTAVFQDEEEAR